MLLDQHQDVVDVHLNLFDQLDLEDEVLVDGFLVSGVVLAHLLVEVQVGAAVVLDVARGFPMTPLDPYGAVGDQLGVEHVDPLVAPRSSDLRRDARTLEDDEFAADHPGAGVDPPRRKHVAENRAVLRRGTLLLARQGVGLTEHLDPRTGGIERIWVKNASASDCWASESVRSCGSARCP